MRVQCAVILLTLHPCAYSVGFAVSTRPDGQEHGIAQTSTLLLCARLPLLFAQQMLPPGPELLLTDAAGLPNQFLKKCIQVSASTATETGATGAHRLCD